MTSQIEPEHYFSKDYDTKWRFISYWHQINDILTLKQNLILEIGIGNSLVANYLKNRGLKVTTLDIDKRLKPDTVGSVLSIPFQEQTFEVVACFEVLEHLFYENFPQALIEIHRVARKYVVLSLPDVTRAYRINIQLPKFGEFKRLISLPRWKPPKHAFDGEHYWEIGKEGYPLEKVMGEMRRAGFHIKETYRVFEMPYHRFFVLAKDQVAPHG
jgi:ubiquinone/menaquinone biosynthesis C-methylase UbiE